jgi:IS5 family transposase
MNITPHTAAARSAFAHCAPNRRSATATTATAALAQSMDTPRTTCYSGGLWGWRWTRRYGITRCSVRNRERLLNEEIAEGFFRRVLERAKPHMSDEHFTVDGTLIEAWASQKSFRRKDGKGKPPGAGGEVDFHGEKRKNQTHESTTDPDARLFKKSKGSEAKLGYLGHVLMENRNGLLVQTFLTEANGRAERDAAMLMAETIPGVKRVTLSGDKNYDTQELVRELRGMNITPHVAQNDTNRRSAVDQRTTRHAGYEVSQRKRKRVEQSFGWMKMVGMLKKVKLRGIDKVGWLFTFTGAAYNLCRLRNLMARA